eukprot:7690167-Heterocapsa_arctica.AAC.1
MFGGKKGGKGKGKGGGRSSGMLGCSICGSPNHQSYICPVSKGKSKGKFGSAYNDGGKGYDDGGKGAMHTQYATPPYMQPAALPATTAPPEPP